MLTMIIQLEDAINRIAKEKDRIDVVVNNAGYALIGAFEENSMEEVKIPI